MDTRHIRISDYNYELPDERIAKFPLQQRDQSKLLVYRQGEVSDDRFCHLPHYLPTGALMVFNNTKVIQARLHFRKQPTVVSEASKLCSTPPDTPIAAHASQRAASQLVGEASKLCSPTPSAPIADHASQHVTAQLVGEASKLCSPPPGALIATHASQHSTSQLVGEASKLCSPSPSAPIADHASQRVTAQLVGEASKLCSPSPSALIPNHASQHVTAQLVGEASKLCSPPPGALIEVFLLEPAHPAEYEQMFLSRGRCSWYCLIGNLKKWKEGTLSTHFTVHNSPFILRATRGPQHGTSHCVDFEWEPAAGDLQSPAAGDLQSPTFAEVLDAVGELPIPPYLNRKAEESDKRTYQTVYSKIKGSVAAPTAGLHFTPEVLAAIDHKGIDREELTLHVGAGTFKPVKSEEIADHEMHTEYISVRRETIDKLLRHNGEAIAVGTTSVRTLESLYWMGVKTYHNPGIDGDSLHVSQWEPYEQPSPLNPQPSTITALTALARWMDEHHLTVLHSSTQIIIAPGYDYRIVKMLVTNFHQPQSTLLLLVSAFVHGDWHRIYDYALGHDFRFLSYGDSSLLIP